MLKRADESPWLEFLRRNAFALLIIALCLIFYTHQSTPGAPGSLPSIAPRNAAILKSFI